MLSDPGRGWPSGPGGPCFERDDFDDPPKSLGFLRCDFFGMSGRASESLWRVDFEPSDEFFLDARPDFPDGSRLGDPGVVEPPAEEWRLVVLGFWDGSLFAESCAFKLPFRPEPKPINTGICV